MEAIDSILLRQIEDSKTPSAQYIIFDKDKVIHRFQSGFADIKNQKKVDEHTTFHAFSVTKTFTALAILQLAEKGKLDVDDSAKQHLPGFPYTNEITIRQLLTHSAGIPNPNPLSWIHLAQEHQAFDGDGYFDQVFKKHHSTKSKPNEKFAYSNLGYVLLGQIVEKVSGQCYEDYVRDNILEPLNLGAKDLDFEIRDKNQHAIGYQNRWNFLNAVLGFFIDKAKYINKAEGKWKPFKSYYVNETSYGGLIGTPDAFVKYIQELLSPDCKLISDNFKKLLLTENHTNSGQPTGMCLSWFKGQLNGKQYFAHAGGGGGYYCEIRIYPDTGIGSVIMFNRTGVTDERFLDRVDRHYLR